MSAQAGTWCDFTMGLVWRVVFCQAAVPAELSGVDLLNFNFSSKLVKIIFLLQVEPELFLGHMSCVLHFDFI